MAKDTRNEASSPETVISIVGPGMRIVGDCEVEGTVRIEGRVEGSVKAGKAVVVGKEGIVDGTVETQDAVIAGAVTGSVVAESRLELQATARIEGDIQARRMQLEEGAMVNGRVNMGETKKPPVRPGVGTSGPGGEGPGRMPGEGGPTEGGEGR